MESKIVNNSIVAKERLETKAADSYRADILHVMSDRHLHLYPRNADALGSNAFVELLGPRFRLRNTRNLHEGYRSDRVVCQIYTITLENVTSMLHGYVRGAPDCGKTQTNFYGHVQK